jgi:hypothetical protein
MPPGVKEFLGHPQAKGEQSGLLQKDYGRVNFRQGTITVD